MRFIDREEELATLERRRRSSQAELVILYGRRRVGKSALLARFAESVERVLFFEAMAAEPADNLAAMESEIAGLPGSNPMRAPARTWQEVFAAIHDLAATSPLLAVLDEFQFIAAKDESIGSHINRLMDANAENPNLMLILSGSDVSFFEDEVMGYAAVTYGRRTAALNLQPFAYQHAAEFMAQLEPEDRIRGYAVFGGMPYYLQSLERLPTLEGAILDDVLLPGSRLQEEPRFLLAQEGRVRDASAYFSVLTAIAAGLSQSNQIAQRVGIDNRIVKHYLDSLAEMGLVENRFPVTHQRPGRTTNWAIKDNFLRFWFRFVAPYASRLVTERRAREHLEVVQRGLDDLTAAPFEEVCRQWVDANMPGVAHTDSWWGSIKARFDGRPRNRRYEADVASVDGEGRLVLLGSCKWTSAPHDFAELEKLRQIQRHLGAEDADLYLFSRSGFDDRLEAEVRADPQVRLVRLDEMAAQALHAR